MKKIILFVLILAIVSIIVIIVYPFFSEERILASFHKCEIESDCVYLLNPPSETIEPGCYNKIEMAKEFCFNKEELPSGGYRCREPITEKEIQQALTELEIDGNIRCRCVEKEIKEGEGQKIEAKLMGICETE